MQNLNHLALTAARKRQSLQTGFVHLFPETIPIYENFCFAFALLRSKTQENVLEGQKLIEKLLAFQTPDGNFPIYLHEYPHAYQSKTALKIAPILIHSLRLFAPTLKESLRSNIQNSLKKALENPSENPFWENRRRACLGEPIVPLDSKYFSADQWTDWIITCQLAGLNHFSIPYEPSLQLFLGPSQFDVQEGREPRPNLIEWLLSDESSRLCKDHPHQILCAPLFPITYTPIQIEENSLRLFWQDEALHSLVGSGAIFDLTEEAQMGRSDLFEAVFYADIGTEVFVEGQKATVFKLEDQIEIRTPSQSISLSFHLTEGVGDFLGHIFPGNRPSQIAKGFQTYDWHIGLRTLRRSPSAQIQIKKLCRNLKGL